MAAVGRMAASTRALRRLLRVNLSEIFLGQVPPRAPQPSSTTRANFCGVSRCAAAARARTQRPSSPATPWARANWGSFLPSQVARWSSPAPPATATTWPQVVQLLRPPLPPPPPSRRPAEASRASYTRVVRTHTRGAGACTLPLTYTDYLTRTPLHCISLAPAPSLGRVYPLTASPQAHRPP